MVLLRKLWRLLARARGWFPLTNLGVVVAGLAAVGYWGFGVPRVDYVIQLVAILSLALVALALFWVVPGALFTHRAFKRRMAQGSTAIAFEARRGFATLLNMPAFAWLPFFELTWSWRSPEGFVVRVDRQGHELIETVEAAERGRADRIVRRFVVEDPFGLCRVALTRVEHRLIEVLPWSGRLVSAPMLRAHTGGEELSHPLGDPIGDRIDMRHYVAGDPLKLVLWKVYARTGELMVRVPERAISPSLRIVAYLPSAAGDEPAAAAARVAVESRLRGDGWVFGADGASDVAEDLAAAIDLIVGSRQARGTDAGDAIGLERFLATAAESERTRLVLFVPAIEGPWLERCLAVVRRRDMPVTAIVCTDGLTDGLTAGGVAAPKFERWLRRAPELDPMQGALTTEEALSTISGAFIAAGAHVVGIERPTGKMLRIGNQIGQHAPLPTRRVA